MEGSMSKRTPGPWHYAYEGSGLHSIYPDGSSEAVATAENSKADAHLIAASPDLLAACKGIMEELERDLYNGGTSTVYSEACRKAIAKATGESNDA